MGRFRSDSPGAFKEELLVEVILFGERSLRRALSEYVDHFHAERNHQGKATSPMARPARRKTASRRTSSSISDIIFDRDNGLLGL